MNETQANFCQANFDPPRQILGKFCTPPGLSFWYGVRARRMRGRGAVGVAGRAGVRVGRQLIASENNPSARARIRCGGAARPSAVRRGGVRCVGLGGSSSRAITISARARATSTRSSSSSQQGWAGGVLAGWLSESAVLDFTRPGGKRNRQIFRDFRALRAQANFESNFEKS